MKIENAVDALSALAHKGRLKIFRMLVKAGPEGIAAGEIARRLDAPPNSLSANLTILSHAGLVEAHRDGRSIIYNARYGQMSRLLGYLMEDCCNGVPEICTPMADVLARTAFCTPKAARAYEHGLLRAEYGVAASCPIPASNRRSNPSPSSTVWSPRGSVLDCFSPSSLASASRQRGWRAEISL
jgi:DNA-binding transcriptional ArsR family regulator